MKRIRKPIWGWAEWFGVEFNLDDSDLTLRRAGRVTMTVRSLLLGSMIAVPTVATEPCHYTWFELPLAGSLNTYAHAINDHGWVTGVATSGGEFNRSFVWRPDTGISTLIPLPPGARSMTAHDINNLGHVVGSLEFTGSGLGQQPFIWDGQQTQVIEMPPGAINGHAYALNETDQVVGQFDAGSELPVRAFLWQEGIFTDVGAMIPVGSKARDINDFGDIVGEAVYPGGIYHAIYIRDKTLHWLAEPVGFDQSFALGINNNGLIVGRARSTTNEWRGIVWEGEPVFVVEFNHGQPVSAFSGVNDAGRALGSCYGPLFDTFVSWQGGRLTVLNPLLTPSPPVSIHNPHGNGVGQFFSWVHGGTLFFQPHWLTGDLNGDCAVAVDDLSILLSYFGSPQGSYPRGDVDQDGDVDLVDLTSLLSNWGR